MCLLCVVYLIIDKLIDNIVLVNTTGYNNDGGPQRWKTFIRLE